MPGQWNFFVDDRPWSGERRLFMRVRNQHLRSTAFVAPLVIVQADPSGPYDVPSLSESAEDRDDRLGDVTGFLQAALDSAWSLGMRPSGFADHTNELSAIRYHLEDMRTLAKLPGNTSK